MQITIELPDDIANQLVLQPANFSRRMLNFSSRWETYEFLKREKAYLPYSEDDLEQDVQAIRKLLATE